MEVGSDIYVNFDYFLSYVGKDLRISTVSLQSHGKLYSMKPLPYTASLKFSLMYRTLQMVLGQEIEAVIAEEW